MLVFLALLLLLVSTFMVGVAEGLRRLRRRVEALERAHAARPALPREKDSSHLAGLRIALDIEQDHPQAPFTKLLRERLTHEDAVVGEEGQLTIAGGIVGNGYADVFYRADLVVQTEGQILFTLNERPPHGDRPENLALEVVERLRTEWTKRERQAAIRELHEP